MQSEAVQAIQKCKRCTRDLPPGALVCSFCHALVNTEELYRLTANANALETKQDFHAARDCWLQALQLLPPDAKQAKWIQAHLTELDGNSVVNGADAPRHPWVQKLGPLGVVLVALAKGKSLLALFKFKFLFSLATFLAFYWKLYGAAFGVGFAVLILLHEMGHYIEVKRRGLPVEMPVFLPGFGAYVRWQALGVSIRTRAAVSLAGPLAGFLSSAACLLLWATTGNHLWGALARTGAWLNVLNLVPVWQLDGGQAVVALSKANRIVLLLTTVLLWIFLRENILLLVAAGAVWQLFDKNATDVSDQKTLAYYAAVLACLTAVMWAVPAQFDPR